MEPAITVSQLNKYIRLKLEQDDVLSQVCVSGELSNVTIHRSGHIYLKLKDEQSVINGVMFRFNANRLDFVPKDGQRVIAYGSISVYEPSGSYQIKITALQPDGQGQLAIAFENLKKKLEAIGLFDASHKKALPKFPKTIGVITSPTGAAVRDIIKVCSRRYPQAEILLYPCLVQGEQAASALTNAVEWFDANRAADVLIIGRGGGSMEDLWAFNDEALAYAVYNSEIPVVSAVGHEIDFTICDFVADVRAATPSMAAELVCPDQSEYLSKLKLYERRLTDLLLGKCQYAEAKLRGLCSRPVFQDETYLVTNRQVTVDSYTQQMQTLIRELLYRKTNIFEKNIAKLDALSPLAVLARGYATVSDKDGNAISSLEEQRVGAHISVRLKNKQANCVVETISEVENGN